MSWIRSRNFRRTVAVIAVVWLVGFGAVFWMLWDTQRVNGLLERIDQHRGIIEIRRKGRPWMYELLGVRYLPLCDSIVHANIYVDGRQVRISELQPLQDADDVALTLDVPTIGEQEWSTLCAFQHVRAVTFLQYPKGAIDVSELRGVRRVTAFVDVDSAACDCAARAEALVSLYLTGESVDDACLRALSAHASVRELFITRGTITLDGVRALRDLASLRNLVLFDVNIGDEAVPELCNLRQLEFLALRETQVTPEGAEELNRALPHVRIWVANLL